MMTSFGNEPGDGACRPVVGERIIDCAGATSADR